MKKKKFEIGIISLASILYCAYCNWIMTELPHLSWFDFMPLVDKYFGNSLQLKDMFSRYGEHGLFGYNILLLINADMFKLTTFFDVYVNDIVVIVTGIVFAVILGRLVEQKTMTYLSGIIMIIMVQFTTIQKSSGAMETQVRLGVFFFLVASIIVDRIFYENELRLRKLISAMILIVLSINVFGTFYSFAGLPMICIICAIIFWKNKKRRDIVAIILTYVVATLVYILEYGILEGSGAVDAKDSLYNVLNIFVHPIVTMKSLFVYNATGIFGSAIFLDGKYSSDIYLILGGVCTLLIVYSIYLFFKSRMYQKTFLPIIFIAYSLGVFIFVLIGRANLDWEWYMNEWYIIHSKIEYIGVIYIFIYSIHNMKMHINFHKMIINIGSIFLVGVLLAANYFEIMRAPSIAKYYENMQPYLFVESSEELPVNSNGGTPLLENVEKTYNAITVLRKYGLSVYRYYPSYEIYQNTIAIKEARNDEKIKNRITSQTGYYDDRWIGKEAEIRVYSNIGEIQLTLYCPFELDGDQTGTLYVNDEFYKEFVFDKDLMEIKVEVPINSEVNLRFENNYSKVSLPDTRELCFVLNIN